LQIRKQRIEGDDSRYRKLDSVVKLLREGDVRLLKGRWLVEEGARMGRWPARQELEVAFPHALWGPEELQMDMQDSEFADFADSKGTLVKIVSVSYCWWSREHPDPDALQATHLRQVLEEFMATYKCNAALFLDYCSLPQMPRTSDEDACFKRCLENMHIWYAHRRIKVWLLRGLALGTRKYRFRGWPTFELAVSTMAHERKDVIDITSFSMTQDYVANLRRLQVKRPPVERPDEFRKALDKLEFSNPEDKEVVASLYAKTFAEVMGLATKLDFSMQRWNSESAISLAKALPHCRSLESLDLQINAIGDRGATAVAEALQHCGSVRHLHLNANEIGDEGAKALAKMMPRCPLLNSMRLKYNRIGDAGAKALAKAIPNCNELELVYLYGNPISIVGGQVLQEAWDTAKGDFGELGIFPPDTRAADIAKEEPGCSIS